MYALLPKTSFRWLIIATLCFAICIHQTCADLSEVGRTMAEIPKLEKSTTPLDPLAETSVAKNTDILQDPRYQDPISQLFLIHMLSSPNYDKLAFAENIKAVETLKQNEKLKEVERKIVEEMESQALSVPENAVKLQLWGKYVNKDWKNLSEEDLDSFIENIIEKIKSDTQTARDMAKKYAKAISSGNYGVIMDNEADDLIYFVLCLEEGIIPKIVLIYGGFSELRYHSVLAFIEAAGKHYKIPKEKLPEVFIGFPHPYEKDEERHPYDFEEGTGYIDDKKRVEYIEISLALERELKNDADNTWKPEGWKHDTFKPGLTALRKMIDEAEYSAIAVLTCPAALTYLIREEPSRAKKIGVTMASPYSYAMNQDGVLYKEAYNGGRQLSLMNELLKSGVDFMGVGGGTARTKGLRTIHDFNVGKHSDNKLYPDPGLKHLEDVLSPKSPFKLWQIIGHAGHNVSTGKWRDWDEMFSEFWKFLKIEPLPREGLKELRDRPKVVIDLLQKVASNSKSSGITKSKKEEDLPKAAKWGLDMVMTILRIWYLFGDQVRWQGPSADLHAAITTKPYVKGILGAVRYASEPWPVKLDKEGKPIKEEELDKFVNSDDSHHFSISDMDYQSIIDKFQKILSHYFEQKERLSSPSPSTG